MNLMNRPNRTAWKDRQIASDVSYSVAERSMISNFWQLKEVDCSLNWSLTSTMENFEVTQSWLR